MIKKLNYVCLFLIGFGLVIIQPQPVTAQNFANFKTAEKAEVQEVASNNSQGEISVRELGDPVGDPLGNPLQASPSKNISEKTESAPPVPIGEKELKNVNSLDELMKMVEPVAGDEFLEGSGEYTLGATDVIEINVMRHPEVSGVFPINKEGEIQYEFVGDIKISGMNKDEATEVITEALSKYIVSPEVNVKIVQYNSKVVYVVGEVFSPGKIYMRGDTISVREALMQAGLPRLSGVTKKSHLIIPTKKGKPKKKFLNVYALLYEGDLRYNDIMKPGDVLYVPPTFLTKVMRAIAPVAAPIGQAAGTRMNMDVIGDTNNRNY